MRIFRCRKAYFEDDDRIDADMKKILQLVDGRKSLASIAFASGMTMADFQKSVKTLIELDLIIPLDAEELVSD